MTPELSRHSQSFSRGLTLLVATPLVLAALFVAAVTMARAAPAIQADDATTTITLHHVDRAPATPTQAQRLYHRVDKAAVEVCGGGDRSLVEVNRAIRNSACWHAAMRRAFAQVGSPRLYEALADDRTP